MPLGSKEAPRRKVIYLTPRSQDKDKKIYPHFSVSHRVNGNTVQLEDETAVSGYLVGIDHGGYEYPKNSGVWIKTFSILLVDGEDLFKIEGSCDTGIARNIMNSVLGTKEFDVMRISLYSKDDEQGITQPKVFISNNGEKTKWKYEYEKDIKPLVREAEDPKRPGKTVKIYHAVNAMLLNDWIEMEQAVADRAKAMGYILPIDTTTVRKPGEGVKATEHLTPAVQEDVNNLRMEDLEPAFPEEHHGADDLPF